MEAQPAKDRIQSNFRVVIRVRPFLSTELRAQPLQQMHAAPTRKQQEQAGLSAVDCLDIDHETNQRISLLREDYEPRTYYFDYVLSDKASQSESYEQIARPVVQDVLDGFNGVIMAYG